MIRAEPVDADFDKLAVDFRRTAALIGNRREADAVLAQFVPKTLEIRLARHERLFALRVVVDVDADDRDALPLALARLGQHPVTPSLAPRHGLGVVL